jgi:hypothetical protein
MICARKETLIKLSRVYSKEYSEAVMKMGGITRKIAKDDWTLAWNLAERARRRSADILIQLRRHTEEHGC